MATATKTRKTAGTVASDGADFGKIRALLESGTKKGVIEDLTNFDVEAIPTGMLGLDIATGVGGFPVGRIVELYGMESCGKSTVLYHLIAEAQKQDFVPIMIETEGSVDRRYLRRIGVDLNNLVVMSPDSMESAIDFIILATETTHEQGKRALLMLDSVAALAPEVMMEDSAEKKYRATQASVWSQQMPKIIATLRKTSGTLIMVNQMRDGMDLYSPPSTPGGKAIKFAASMRVLMRRKIDKDKDADAGGIFGQEIAFVIEKNKMASPYRKGLAYLPAGRRVDLTQDVLARAVERGVIEKDVKFENGEFISKKGWFTLNPDDAMEKAIAKDIARAEKANAELPGGKAGAYLTTEGPISVFYEKTMFEMLDMAPNLVAALKARILATLAEEAEYIDDEDPFDARLREAIREFDAEAEDGLSTDEHVAAARKDAAVSEDISDDLAEFATQS